MATVQRLLAVAFLPVVALLISQVYYPNSVQNIQAAIQYYVSDVQLFHTFVSEQLPTRSDTPLVVTAFAHWSHYEKIAQIATVLADLGYPITFITGKVFEDEVKTLHPNITFWPIRGKPDKMTEEDYELMKTFEPGSDEQAIFMQKKAMIDSMPDQHDTLQEVFQDFQRKYGQSKPLISLYDLPYAGHHPILLGAPGIKPDATFALSCHPVTLNSNDTFPFYMGKRPHSGQDAKAIHREANRPEYMDYATREVSKAYWEKVRDFGAVDVHDWHIYHTMSALPDYLMSLGVPEFEFVRSDLRPNIHYFGGLKTRKQHSIREADLPSWWGDVAAAKSAGKQIVAVSQGTVGTNLDDLLLPTLEALKDMQNVLVIATTVAMDVADVQGLVVPSNTRVAKFVPYDLLLPQIDVLVNNGGYGAVIKSLQFGIPMVLAGKGQDKNITNTIVGWKEVGINLGRADPSVNEVREGVTQVLADKKFKRNAVAMSKHFERYDLGKIFDDVIQGVVRKRKKQQAE